MAGMSRRTWTTARCGQSACGEIVPLCCSALASISEHRRIHTQGRGGFGQGWGSSLRGVTHASSMWKRCLWMGAHGGWKRRFVGCPRVAVVDLVWGDLVGAFGDACCSRIAMGASRKRRLTAELPRGFREVDIEAYTQGAEGLFRIVQMRIAVRYLHTI